MTATNLLSSTTVPPPPQVGIAPEYCLRRRLRDFPCTKCSDICHTQAITIDQTGSITINHSACTGCGGCFAACPSEAFSLTAMDIEQAVVNAKPHDELVITCDKQPYGAANSLHCPCLATLSPEILTALLLQNRQRIYVNVSNCTDCYNQPATASFREHLNRLEQYLAGLLSCSIVVAYTSNQLPPASQNNRRSFLTDIGRNVFKLIRGRYQPTGNTASNSPGHRRSIPHRLATVDNALQSLSAEPQRAIKAVLHPRLQIGQACSICPRCAGICPTGAISRRRKEADSKHHLAFAPERCTGCGLCVAFCEKHAIRLSSSLLSHGNLTSHVKDGPASVEHPI